jgi:outer membrane usher protein
VRGESRAALIAFAILSAVAPGIGRSDPASVPDAPAEPEGSNQPAEPGIPAFLDLEVNAAPGESVLVYVGSDGDAWVAAEDLERARLSGFGGVRRNVNGTPFVSLRSIAPDLAFDVDERALALRVNAGPALLGHTRHDLVPRLRPPDWAVSSELGSYLNYSVRADTEREVSGFGEAGVSWGPALLSSTASWRREGDVVRGLTALTVERFERLQRLTLGDMVARGDALGGSAILLGLGAARDLSLDPYLVQTPLPSASGFASTPSVLEVWVNGRLVREVAVTPGAFELANIPVSSGTSDVRTVIRDAFGRTQAIDATAHLASGQLAAGLRDWSVQGGFVRRRYGLESFDYGDPAAMGRWRAGLNRWFTAAGRVETTTHGLLSGGGTLVTATPAGELEAGVAGSLDRADSGAAGLVAWRFGTRWFASSAHLRLLSRAYANLSLPAEYERELWRGGVVFSAPARWGSVTVDYTAGHPRSGGLNERGSLRLTFVLQGGALFSVSASGSRGPGVPSDVGVLAMLQLPVGHRTHTDVSAEMRRGPIDGPVASAGAQRTLPAGDGYGYRIRGTADPEASSASALVQAQRSFGRFEASYDTLADGRDFGAVTVAGGVVATGGKVRFTRPLHQGYALVSVGIPGVRTFFDNQPIGRTDEDGEILVTGLLPYYGHAVSIDDVDVPMGHAVPETRRIVATPNRGAALVRFDVKRMQVVTGLLMAPGPDGATIPGYGTLEVELMDRRLASPITSEGMFWLDDVPPGHHPAQITWKGGTCGFTLTVPDSGTEITNVGAVGCAVPE